MEELQSCFVVSSTAYRRFRLRLFCASRRRLSAGNVFGFYSPAFGFCLSCGFFTRPFGFWARLLIRLCCFLPCTPDGLRFEPMFLVPSIRAALVAPEVIGDLANLFIAFGLGNRFAHFSHRTF